MLSLRGAVESWLRAASLPEGTVRQAAIFIKALHLRVFVVIFFSWQNIMEMRWVVVPYLTQETDYLYTFFAIFVHDSVSIIHHQVVCCCRTGYNYSKYTSSKPFHLLWYERLCHDYCFQGDDKCAIRSAPGLSCCYSSVKSMMQKLKTGGG